MKDLTEEEAATAGAELARLGGRYTFRRVRYSWDELLEVQRLVHATVAGHRDRAALSGVGPRPDRNVVVATVRAEATELMQAIIDACPPQSVEIEEGQLIMTLLEG